MCAAIESSNMDSFPPEQRCVATRRTAAPAPTSRCAGSSTWSMAAARASGTAAVKATSTNLRRRMSVRPPAWTLREWVSMLGNICFHFIFLFILFLFLFLFSLSLYSFIFFKDGYIILA